MSAEELDPAAFAQAFQRFVERMAAAAPPPLNVVRTQVLEHLGVDDATDLPSVRDQVTPADHVNLQLALDHHFRDRPHRIIGLPRELEHYEIGRAHV